MARRAPALHFFFSDHVVSFHGSLAALTVRMKLQARDLDAWLAEWLFGVLKPESVPQPGASSVWWHDVKGGEWIPHEFSTTYEGMGRVLEAMKSKKCNITITLGMGGWGAYFSFDTLRKGVANADTLPRAVALAAKAALEKEG